MQTLIASPEVETELTQQEKDLFFWDEVAPRIRQFIGAWSGEITSTKNRRNERYVDVDVEQLRRTGQIQADETMIPVRVIDSNIVREEPAYSAYIKNSRRLVIFKKQGLPGQDLERLSLEVTEGLRYNGMFKEIYRARDGAALHGWDSIEVVFDESKPLHVGFEHIGHDRLFFDKNCQDIQDSEFVVRHYKITGTTLQSFVLDYGFNSDQVDTILRPTESSTKKFTESFDIYKLFFKYQNIVFVAWFAKDYGVNDWLKDPEPLRLGIAHQEMIPAEEQFSASSFAQGGMLPSAPTWVDDFIDIYPIFVLPYKENEEKEITAKVGRGFLDGDWQEAQTCTVTGFVNGILRAANVYAAPDSQDESETSMRQLDVVLENGKIFSKPLKFFHTDYPEAVTLSALNYLGSANAQQAGQPDYAAMNRKDSRKTATEVEKATEEATMLKSTPIALFSEWLRGALTFSWRIIQSQALQGKVPLLLIPDQSGMYTNNIELIGQEFLIFPAGDVDVVQRAEKIAQMMQDWPVIGQTSLGPRFLADLMRLKYPDVGDEYADILLSQPSGAQLIQALSAMVQQLVTPEEVNALPPEQQQQLVQLQQQVQQYLTQGQ